MLWRVNSELIDTLWNVNFCYTLPASASQSWINRYIMECKYAHTNDIAYAITELIDTLWNVNLSTIAYHCGYFAN